MDIVKTIIAAGGLNALITIMALKVAILALRLALRKQ